MTALALACDGEELGLLLELMLKHLGIDRFCVGEAKTDFTWTCVEESRAKAIRILWAR